MERHAPSVVIATHFSGPELWFWLPTLGDL